MSILSILASSNYITVNKDLIKTVGLEEAIIFGELCSEYTYWEQQGKLIDGMFYCSVDKLEEATTLSEYKQRQAIKNLIDSGYITQELRGLPATRYFKIVSEQVLKLFRIRSEKITELDPEKLQSSNNTINKNSKKEKTNKKDMAKTTNSLLPESCNKQHIIEDVYNLYLEKCPNLPKPRTLNEKRKRLIFNAYKIYGVKVLEELFVKANASDFLCGKNDRGWKADIEWLLGDKSVNVLEGKYDNHKKTVKNNSWEDSVTSTTKLTKEQKQAIEDKANRLEAQGIKMRF